ncbi:PucR family transcriptional regulator ligand-binding domain-containing protein [Rhodococcus sp. H29-C3]|uniref:helix-turn-helix domain-containing protein n=1 Tax=Rhodococcus sp. H29-C3 TaxID=3046307 RepID=UPI0024BB4E9D|nr:PucR family transcriptional regulator ligand-binding domain-containing protein [Rhodococcus sp. H29-C3]MDJ0361931.1 PucR family transcriptional regulator ligand-binding domain-containing protein [Rhodococcus sp. H29-C3]
MLPTLREVLALPSFKAAAIEVLAGSPDTAVIRWVHSSEVYEMGGLLAGGELLLTTGLGLHGRSAEQLTAYLDQVADAGCVALAMEVGRSFLTAPPELVAASRRRGVAFLTLHTVVPFERMVEDFHDLILRRRLGSPRAGEPVWQELLDIVVAGQGMTALLNGIARLAGCGVDLVDAEGRVVERNATAAERSESERTILDVRGPTGSLGRLVLSGRATARRSAVANCAAVAVALELGRHPDLGPRQSLAQSVITDLVGGVLTSHGDLSERLSAAGWTPLDGKHMLVAAVDVDHRTPVRELADPVREAVEAVLGRCLIGVTANHVVVLAHGWLLASPGRVRAAFTEVDELLRRGPGGSAIRTLGVAAPVKQLSDISTALGQAREVVQIARRFGTRTGVILARDVGIQRLLAAGVAATMLNAFVAEQLGPVIAYDTKHSADLVRTLDAFIANRGSKAQTAVLLGIRRQSLYARLARLEKLLGASLDDPMQLVCLGLALTAWRMKTGLDPQAAFARSPYGQA